jgi:hypothetical protein
MVELFVLIDIAARRTDGSSKTNGSIPFLTDMNKIMHHWGPTIKSISYEEGWDEYE